MTDEPRIVPLPPTAWPSEMSQAIKALRPPEPRHELPSRAPGRPKGLNALGTLAHHPALTTAFHTFNGHVQFATTITPRQRELLILRVAVLRDAAYEWAQHVIIGADHGIDDATLDRIVAGPDADGWDGLDAALLRCVDELLADAVVGDTTWATLAAELDVQQLMDVVFTVGAYDIVAMAFKSFGVEVDDDLSHVRKPASP
jgi:alkylhydroperoxidase family enzyme